MMNHSGLLNDSLKMSTGKMCNDCMYNTTDQINLYFHQNVTVPSNISKDGSSAYIEHLRSISGIVNTVVYNYGLLLIASIGITSNLLVIITMIGSRRLRNNSAGIMMIFLAFVDEVVLLSYIVRNTRLFHLDIHQPYCGIFEYLNTVSRSLSHLILLLISVNRYALVCHPLKHRMVTSIKATWIQLCICFILCSGAGVYVLLSFDRDSTFCILSKDERVMIIYYTGIIVVFMVFSNLVPLTLIIVFTFLVISALRHHRQTLGAANQSVKRKQSEKQLTQALVAVNISFILLSLPYVIIYIVYFGETTFSVEAILYLEIIVRLLALTDSMVHVINFFLYLWYSKIFRSSLVGIFSCKIKSRETATTDETGRTENSVTESTQL